MTETQQVNSSRRRTGTGPVVIHEDLSQISGGHLRTRLILGIVLLLAAGTDIGTFYQVILLVLNVPEELEWVIVTGFTAVSLWLIHHTGVHARRRAGARNPVGSKTSAWITFGLWFTLGLIAFVVRYRISPGSGSGGGSQITTDTGNPTSLIDQAQLTRQHLSAFMFLALYLGTGAVAGIAGFFRPNPAARQYAVTLSRRYKAARREASSGAWLARVDRIVTAVEEARDHAARRANHMQLEGVDAGERLKNEVRLRLHREAS